MKLSKGQPRPEIVAEFRLLDSLHGSGITTILTPGFDCDLDPETTSGKQLLDLPSPAFDGCFCLGGEESTSSNSLMWGLLQNHVKFFGRLV